MCFSGLMVRLRRWWVARRCASADGEKDEKGENISGAVVTAAAVTRKFSYCAARMVAQV